MDAHPYQSCVYGRDHDLGETDYHWGQVVRNLCVLTKAQIDLLGIRKSEIEDFEDFVADLRIDGQPDRLWRDWSNSRDDVYWLEELDFSGSLIEMSSFLTEMHEDESRKGSI